MRRRPTRVRARAVAVGLLLAAGMATAMATPAHAHTRSEETTNIDSRLTAVPPIDGVTWRVHTGGQLVEVVNRSGDDLIVYGYEGEPYLRIGPGGVERNRRSPAAYLNDERFGDVAVPPHVDPSAKPEWVRLATEARWLWHDHRTHWMSPQPPGFVEVGPAARLLMRARLVGPIGGAGVPGAFQEWAIPIRHADTDLVVGGELAWQPAPPAWPWLAAGLLLVSPPVLLTARRRPGAARWSAAFVVAAVAALGTIHLVDDLLAWPADILDDLFGVLHTTLFLIVGLGGAGWALRGQQGRGLALGIASGAVLYHQGLLHLPMLLASQFPTVWHQGLVRLTVAVALTQALSVALVLALARRSDAARDEGPHPGSPSAGDRRSHMSMPQPSVRSSRAEKL